MKIIILSLLLLLSITCLFLLNPQSKQQPVTTKATNTINKSKPKRPVVVPMKNDTKLDTKELEHLQAKENLNLALSGQLKPDRSKNETDLSSRVTVSQDQDGNIIMGYKIKEKSPAARAADLENQANQDANDLFNPNTDNDGQIDLKNMKIQ